MRPLPSDSNTQTVPVSATAKFAPEIPDARRQELAPQVQPRGLGERRRLVGQVGQVELAREQVADLRRFLWIAGTRMCDWTSSPSWMISSARSVSTARTPGGRERLVELDLVGGDRLDLHHLVDARWRARSRRRSRRPRRRRAPSAPDPAGGRRRPPRGARAGRSRSASAASLIARPASRSSSQSGSSPTTAARLARIVVVALPRLRRSCESRSAARAAAGSSTAHRPSDLARGARVAHAGALARERAADVHQAGVVGRADDLRARVEHGAHLVGQHRRRDLGVLDREGPAEAAALGRLGQLDQLDPPDRPAAGAAAGPPRRARAASGRSGGSVTRCGK